MESPRSYSSSCSPGRERLGAAEAKQPGAGAASSRETLRRDGLPTALWAGVGRAEDVAVHNAKRKQSQQREKDKDERARARVDQ